MRDRGTYRLSRPLPCIPPLDPLQPFHSHVYQDKDRAGGTGCLSYLPIAHFQHPGGLLQSRYLRDDRDQFLNRPRCNLETSPLFTPVVASFITKASHHSSLFCHFQFHEPARMSSPNSSPSDVSPQGRKIAPLPRRSRLSSNPGSSQSILSSDGTPTPDSSSETTHSLSASSTTSFGQFNSQNLDSIPDAGHASPPPLDVPRLVFQSGQPGSSSTSEQQYQDHTSHLLHNLTPKKSPEPEATRFSTPDSQILQPLHTMYSDEKIMILPSDIRQRRGISSASAGDLLEDTADASYIFASRPGTPLQLPYHTTHLNPGLNVPRPRSSSDASDISDNNENPAPYDVGDEEAPPELFFSPIFQAALHTGLDIANELESCMERLFTLSERSNDLDRLINDAKRLGTFQSSDTRTIAVLGDSGEGNLDVSFCLLSLIFSQERVVSSMPCSTFPKSRKLYVQIVFWRDSGAYYFGQGDIGAACTSVVTEYRQKTTEHKSPITIEVEYLSPPEIESLIKELLWNYRQMYLPNIEDDGINAQDYARYQRESEQAWSALEAGFKHQRGFNKQLISNMSEGGLERATDQLVQWAHELNWPDGCDAGIWSAVADTAEECCDLTSVFMQDRFWPFTKIIRYIQIFNLAHRQVLF
jgi:hypothetical protein